MNTSTKKTAPSTPGILTLSIVAAAAVVLALPMLFHGPLAQGHDATEHINFARHFSEQFWEGELCPRWLAGMNRGLGSPTFFVFPPFPSYASALLEPAGKIFHFNPFNMGEFLALLGSGICASFWLSTMASQRVACAGAILYMLMPYHLAVDFYRRAALPECWAFVWMPLVLYFTARAMRRERVYLVGLAVAYACLILSHLISVLIFSLIPLAAVLTQSARGQKVKSALRIAEGMFLGTGLSCFYLVPALFHARYFPASKLYPWSFVQENLIATPALLHAGGFVHAISLTVLAMIALGVLCSVIVFAQGSKDSKTKVLFWFAICVIPVFLMFRLSFPVWKMCPLLFAAIQFPWRLNIVLCIAAIAIVTVFLSEAPRLPRWSQAWSLVLVGMLIVPWFMAYGDIWKRYRMEAAHPAEAVPLVPHVDDHDGWFSAWSPPGIDEKKAINASTGPEAKFLTGEGTANVLVWKPRHIEFEANSATGGWVMVRQFYYPSWRASLVGPDKASQTLDIDIKAAMPEGLLELQVPPGRQQIELEIPVGRAERAGYWISVMSALLCAGVTWRQRRENRNLPRWPSPDSRASETAR
jgi:6-pyruvoyl-tetrahydropterin synthase related domain